MRSIAERLAYNRRYSPKLNPKLFNEDNELYPEIRDKVEEIVDKFLEYTQIDNINILDIRLVGSNASYNYNENSDFDIHIVVDLSKISDPKTIASLYFGEVKSSFKDNYDIKIKGIEVEMYVEDLNSSPKSNGIYSVSRNLWIKEPTPMEDPSREEWDEAERIEDEYIERMEAAKDSDELEDIINQIYLDRKDGLDAEGETSPRNLAFKSLRNKGIIKRFKDTVKEKVSKELSLESKQ